MSGRDYSAHPCASPLRGRRWRGVRDRSRRSWSNPRGVAAHLISSQRRYDCFGTSPGRLSYQRA